MKKGVDGDDGGEDDDDDDGVEEDDSGDKNTHLSWMNWIINQLSHQVLPIASVQRRSSRRIW